MHKRFMLIIPSFDMGGAERQAFNYALYLKAIGREVMIVSYRKGEIISKLCEENQIKYRIFDKPNAIMYFVLRALRKLNIVSKEVNLFFEVLAFPLAKYIKKNNYDICISYCTESNIWLGASIRYNKKAVYFWYQRDAGIFNKGDSYEKQLIDRFDYVLSNGESGKKYLEDTFHKNVLLIKNGVKLSAVKRSKEEWRRDLRISEDYMVCTMIANLHSAKDHESILEIWNRFIKKDLGIKAILVFAGRKDDTYNMLKSYVIENGLNDSVRFLGMVEDVSGLLNVSDICVFGAKAEGSPNGIIEATLMGLPVVATDLPEIREVISEDNIPLLFSKGAYDYATERITELCMNNEIRHKIGEKNKLKSMETYDYEKNFNKLTQLAETVKK